MRDIWAFLLQTLTASGAALLLLAVKAMFRDKLSPRWQFSAWGILAVILLVPAGLGGRYALVNWPFYVEAARSALTGEFGALATVAAPVPLPPSAPPRSAADWLFLIYAAGAALLLARYAVSYIRLRLALRRGRPADDAPIRDAAERYGLPACPAVEVEGLPSAFVCGVFRPVLALPAGKEVDEKVLLHELLHLKHHDAAWGLVIGFFRCVHWCNPLLWLCANLAGNDLESLCDQRALERLEGEDRRDYGRILLDMADEKYARAPGTSSMANGGKNIRRRIEAIARFKRYPRDMGLVSVCVALVLAAPLLAGQKASAMDGYNVLITGWETAAMAAARTTYCTTCAGAFDTYAKAVLKEYIPYRAMCAPLAEQDELAAAYRREAEAGAWDWADAGLPYEPAMQEGYDIYNLVEVEPDVWEGLLAVTSGEVPAGEEWDGTAHSRWMMVQPLRAEREGPRWVVRPLEGFRCVQGDRRDGGSLGLPAWEYRGTAGDFALVIRWQTSSHVDSYNQTGNWFGSYLEFDLTPQPDGAFTSWFWDSMMAVYTGGPADREKYTHIGASSMPVWEEQERPGLRNPGTGNGGGSSSSGDAWGAQSLSGWWQEEGGTVFLSGGGSSRKGVIPRPDRYAADLYLNGELAAELTLLPKPEGGLNLD